MKTFRVCDDLQAVSEALPPAEEDGCQVRQQKHLSGSPTLLLELCLQRAVERHSVGQSDEAVEALAFDGMRSAHHGGLGDGLVLHESRLHLRRTQEVACGDSTGGGGQLTALTKRMFRTDVYRTIDSGGQVSVLKPVFCLSDVKYDLKRTMEEKIYP